MSARDIPDISGREAQGLRGLPMRPARCRAHQESPSISSWLRPSSGIASRSVTVKGRHTGWLMATIVRSFLARANLAIRSTPPPAMNSLTRRPDHAADAAPAEAD